MKKYNFLRRIFRVEIVLFVFSGIFAVFFLELAVRFLYPVSINSFMVGSTKTWQTPLPERNQLLLLSRTLGYELAPNGNSVNSLGMMDKERIKYKAEGVYRILCLGDSTTANSQYVEMLETFLNQRNLNNKKFEVWNCGVFGYGILQYCRVFKEKWLKYDPDMVIIGFCLNDFETTPLVIREKNNLVGYFPHREILPYINPFLFRNSHIYRFFIKRSFLWKTNGYENIKELADSNLKELKNSLLTKKIPLLIVVFGLPMPFENYIPEYKRVYRQIKGIIEDNDIDSLDMVPIFENNDPLNLSLFPGDPLHFNERGSKVIAETIYSYVEQALRK